MKKINLLLTILIIASLVAIALNQKEKGNSEPVKLQQNESVYFTDYENHQLINVSASKTENEIHADKVLCKNTEKENDKASGFDFQTILNIVLSIVSVVFAGIWLKLKGKISQIVNLGRQLIEAGKAIEDALGDNKISDEEIKTIKKEFNDVKEAFKELIKFSSQ
jgi:hypothetical protein